MLFSKDGVALSLHPDFILEMDIRTDIGHASKLRDVFKLSEMLAWKLDAIIEEKLIFPNIYWIPFS